MLNTSIFYNFNLFYKSRTQMNCYVNKGKIDMELKYGGGCCIYFFIYHLYYAFG